LIERRIENLRLIIKNNIAKTKRENMEEYINELKGYIIRNEPRQGSEETR